MPVFTQQKKEVKKAGRPAGIPQEIVDEYKAYIEKLEKGNIGTLEFKKGENVNLARRALKQASAELKKYVRIRKPRGAASTLHLEHIKRAEWAAAQKTAKERGAKLKGKPKAKAKAKKK